MKIRILGLCGWLLMLTITGCVEKEYQGEVAASEYYSPGSAIGKLNTNGRDLYNQQCASCHGVNGAGTQIGTPLIGCATCTSVEAMSRYTELNMPISKPQSCVGSCATDTSEYILYAFNGISLNQARSALNGVSSMSPVNTLRKASLAVAGRMPTQSELKSVEAGGDAALQTVLDNMMNEETFYERLAEMFNDQLLTDKYMSENNSTGGIQLLSMDDFPNRSWYDNDDSIIADDKDCYRRLTNDAVAREPLALIQYLARNHLPHTGTVNADYFMVTWYSQKTYDASLLAGKSFRLATDEVKTKVKNSYWSCRNTEVTYDPYDFQPAQIKKATEYSATGIPHAGVMTSAMFLNRFPTSYTNRNRARYVYDFFLDTNILQIEGARPSGEDEFNSPNPTLDNPACYTCHMVMDPVASTFQHWTDTGRYIQTSLRNRDNPWDSAGIEAPGFAGVSVPISGPNNQFSAMLQWLGDEIAKDPRFQRATVRTVYRGLVGTEPLPAPAENASSAVKDAYNAQRSILGEIGQAFASSDYDIRAVVKGIVMSPYFRAERIESSAMAANQNTGAVRLLTPEQMQRKLESIFGVKWSDLTNKDNRILFGGIDSDGVISRMTDVNGIMVAMQKRLASEQSCKAVAYDFLREHSISKNERKLFPFVDATTTPQSASDIEAIKKNIQYLHWLLLGEDIGITHAEIAATYDVFYQFWQQGNALLADRDTKNPDGSYKYDPRPSTYLYWNCRARWDLTTGAELPVEQRLEQDTNYVIRA